MLYIKKISATEHMEKAAFSFLIGVSQVHFIHHSADEKSEKHHICLHFPLQYGILFVLIL